MKQQVTYPQLSQKSDKGMLVAWHKEVGQPVTAGEVLYEVETEKAVHQIESLYSGILAEVLKEEGEELTNGDILALIEEVVS
ncbi:lipoyl domain-containing protein [Vagococcus acidifermentans]|nr:lipoyl domain-containing protein [Vagococcus acidifermentans]